MKHEVAKFKQTLAVIGALASMICYAPASQAGEWKRVSSAEWNVIVDGTSKVETLVDNSGKTVGNQLKSNEYLGAFALRNASSHKLGTGYAAMRLDGTWNGLNSTIWNDSKNGSMQIVAKPNGNWNATKYEAGLFRYDAELDKNAKTNWIEIRSAADQLLTPGKYTLKAHGHYWAD